MRHKKDIALPGHIAYLGLGSNIGDRKKNLEKAISELSLHKGIRVMACSSLYETEPVGYKDQGWFINQAVEIETSILPVDLLNITQGIEKKLGRKRGIRWGPRQIDIDILIYDKLSIKTEKLIIPHPRLHERRFVLIPLAEIAPTLTHPSMGKDIEAILIDTPDNNLVKRI